MTEKNKNSKNKEMPETDPFDELNELDDNFTSIETEKDYFNDLERKDVEELPDYDSESGEIIHKEVEKKLQSPKPRKKKFHSWTKLTTSQYQIQTHYPNRLYFINQNL